MSFMSISHSLSLSRSLSLSLSLHWCVGGKQTRQTHSAGAWHANSRVKRGSREWSSLAIAKNLFRTSKLNSAKECPRLQQKNQVTTEQGIGQGGAHNPPTDVKTKHGHGSTLGRSF